MTFLISLPSMFNKMMGLKNLGISYDALLGFRMTIVVKVLK